LQATNISNKTSKKSSKIVEVVSSSSFCILASSKAQVNSRRKPRMRRLHQPQRFWKASSITHPDRWQTNIVECVMVRNADLARQGGKVLNCWLTDKLLEKNFVSPKERNMRKLYTTIIVTTAKTNRIIILILQHNTATLCSFDPKTGRIMIRIIDELINYN
jgi:hypothetical protein